VSYWLHPEAAEEHKSQVAHYEEIQAGLGNGTTPNFKVSWLGFVLRLIAHALFLPRIFDV